LQPYQNPSLFFTGRKLRPRGIGIEVTAYTVSNETLNRTHSLTHRLATIHASQIVDRYNPAT